MNLNHQRKGLFYLDFIFPEDSWSSIWNLIKIFWSVSSQMHTDDLCCTLHWLKLIVPGDGSFTGSRFSLGERGMSSVPAEVRGGAGWWAHPAVEATEMQSPFTVLAVYVIYCTLLDTVNKKFFWEWTLSLAVHFLFRDRACVSMFI